MKHTKKLTKIWGIKFWEERAEKIEMAYWEQIKKGKLLPSVPAILGQKTEHRIEKFVRKLSAKKKEGNLHVGLTSSDLEDNIRAMRLDECLELVRIEGQLLHRELTLLTDYPLIAYTHLLPAGVTSLQRRLAPQLNILVRFPPLVQFKGIGGALGDRKIQSLMGMKEQDIQGIEGKIFEEGHMQRRSNQTVDHTYEIAVATYLGTLASTLAKMANDFRLMFAFGQARSKQDDIGSTAIPGKRPNPWRFERIVGMAEAIYDLPSQIFRIAAGCNLERTLTNQSFLNYSFKQAFSVVLEMFDDFREGIERIEIINQTEECSKAKYHTEGEMLRLIKAGISRGEAHLTVNKKYGN